MNRSTRFAFAVAAFTAMACTDALGATMTRLPDPPAPTFTWNQFGNFGGYATTVVKEYRNEAGTAQGPLYVLGETLEFNCNGQNYNLGIHNWQYALWRGNKAGNVAGANDQVGAAFMGA